MPGYKSNAAQAGLLALLFQNKPFAGIGDADGLRGSVSPGQFFIALHLDDPGQGGDQSISECSYIGYARIAVNRNDSAFLISGESPTQVEFSSDMPFPMCSAGGQQIALFFSVGTEASGSSPLLYVGPITPAIVIKPSVAPVLKAATAVTED